MTSSILGNKSLFSFHEEKIKYLVYQGDINKRNVDHKNQLMFHDFSPTETKHWILFGLHLWNSYPLHLSLTSIMKCLNAWCYIDSADFLDTGLWKGIQKSTETRPCNHSSACCQQISRWQVKYFKIFVYKCVWKMLSCMVSGLFTLLSMPCMIYV